MAEPRIWILPSEVAERIAAGEVVERPASVVKELVENALDAGARRISVETEAGGKALIRVTDDGQGMTPVEARLALQRHATSKLRVADDLFNIHTLGFRGEALPSIGAVSEMEILTRTPDSGEGTRLVIEGGLVRTEEPGAAPVGTTITIRRLFFNVPVREKFLRSDTTEANQITEWLQRLALSRCDVTFRLLHDGREALLSPGSQDLLNAVVAVLGRAVARDLLRLPAPPDGAEGVTVTGFVGRPTLTRSSRSSQHIYVNGRAVRSPIFYRALDDAFRATMPQGRYPVALLFVRVPPGEVDVNVHPAKTEVRFGDEAAVHRAVYRAVQTALRAEGSLPAEEAAPFPTDSDRPPVYPSPRVAEPGAPPPALPFADRAIGGPPDRSERWNPDRGGSPGAGGPGHAQGGWPSIRPPSPPADVDEERDLFDEPGDERPAHPSDSPSAGTSALSLQLSAVSTRPEAPAPALEELNLLGQAQDLFILAEARGRLWIIDQHVAHERILFDQITATDRVREQPQPLLLPATLDLNRTEGLALDEHRELLGDLGFLVEPFGPLRFALRAVPPSLVGRNYEAAFRDLVDELTELSRGGQLRLKREEVAAAAAGRSCKRAVKAGQRLSRTEMERLLTGLRSTRNPYTCPHGRPVFLVYEQQDLAALFGSRSCE